MFNLQSFHQSKKNTICERQVTTSLFVKNVQVFLLSSGNRNERIKEEIYTADLDVDLWTSP